ncbi:MAG: CsgG/HfaB family protein [Candidatus Desantisbacteria bacterium]|mgnify:CR=1 FL=1
MRIIVQFICSLSLIILPVLSSFVYAQNADNIPPTITINTPLENAKVFRKVIIRGIVSDNTVVHRLLIDDEELGISSEKSVLFSHEMQLPNVGQHTIVVTAYDLAGNKTTQKVTVISRIEAHVAVTDFATENVSQIEAVFASDVIRRSIVNSRVFKVVDKQDMEMILKEHAFQQTGCTTEDCAIKMGHILNAQYMFVGKLNSINEIYYLWVKMVDVETGEIIMDESEECSSRKPKDLEKAADHIVNRIIEKLIGNEKLTQQNGRLPSVPQSHEPCIMQLSGKKAVINKGSSDRVKKRDLYEIYQDGILIGLLQIGGEVYSEKAVGMITWQAKDKPIKTGLPIVYIGKKKVAGIGLMLGGHDDAFGINLYLDYIDSISNLGFQCGVGGYGYSKYESNYVYDDSYPHYSSKSIDISSSKSIDISYSSPFLIKYHINPNNSLPVSVYMGFGSSKAGHEYQQYGSYNGSYSDKSIKRVPVINLGMDLFTRSTIHLTLDYKHFMGEEFHGYDTAIKISSIGVSVNW